MSPVHFSTGSAGCCGRSRPRTSTIGTHPPLPFFSNATPRRWGGGMWRPALNGPAAVPWEADCSSLFLLAPWGAALPLPSPMRSTRAQRAARPRHWSWPAWRNERYRGYNCTGQQDWTEGKREGAPPTPWQWSSNKKREKVRGREGGFFVVLTVLFCGVLTKEPCPLLRIGTSQPEAHHGSARLCFFYRPKLAFFSPVLFSIF